MTSGLLIVDKPSGPTSFAVVARVRRLYRERQVGHGGTLDPLASGVLPLLVGQATKLVPFLMGLEKAYEATIRLGVTTDTYDAQGRVTAEADALSIAALEERRIAEVLREFVGTIRQRPPVYSALKKDGQRFYQLARAQGETAPAPEEREVEIHEIQLERVSLPEIRIVVRCGKGTYIRSLAHDLGARLGVGAHLVGLRRTRVGDFSLERAHDVFALDAPVALVGLRQAVSHLPACAVTAAEALQLRCGQQQPLSRIARLASGDTTSCCLTDPDGELVAIGTWSRGSLELSRVFGVSAPRA